jgi:hypothetical protein
MRKKLHPVVLTVGILQVLFGLLGMCCGGFGIIGAVVLFTDPRYSADAPPKPPPGKVAPGTVKPMGFDAQEELIRRVPGYRAVETGRAFVGLFLGFLMVVSGIGLFFMQSWARWLAIGYAVLSIFTSCCLLGYQMGFVLPAATEIADELAAQGAYSSAGTGFKIGMYIGVGIAFALALYPILVLVLLLIPPVNRAFKGEPAADDGLGDFRNRDDYRDRFRGGDDDRYAGQ